MYYQLKFAFLVWLQLRAITQAKVGSYWKNGEMCTGFYIFLWWNWHMSFSSAWTSWWISSPYMYAIIVSTINRSKWCISALFLLCLSNYACGPHHSLVCLTFDFKLTHSDELPYFLLGGKATVWNYLSPFLLRCQAKADQLRATTHAKFDQLRAITLRPFLLMCLAKIDQLRAIEDMVC